MRGWYPKGAFSVFHQTTALFAILSQRTCSTKNIVAQIY